MFTLQVNTGHNSSTPEQFDPDQHTWAKFYRESDEQWQKGPGRDNLPPGKIFSEIEEALKKDDGKELKSIIFQATGTPDIDPKATTITIVNRGRMQVVTKVDVTYDTETEKNSTFSFIAIITLGNDEEAREYGQEDFRAIWHLRTYEKSTHATFPKQYYGTTITPGGHHIQYSEFLEGFYEVNLKVWKSKIFKDDRVNHAVVLNGYTQGEGFDVMNEEVSRKIMGNIVRHQVTTAIQCHAAIAPSFASGDYLYNEDDDRLVLHTGPNRNYDEESDLWRKLKKLHPFSAPEEETNPKIYYAAAQILHMLTAQEFNIYPMKNNECEDELFYVYEIPTIVHSLVEMAKTSDALTIEEWEQVLDLMGRWLEFIFTDIKTNPQHIEILLISLIPTLKDRINRFYAGMELELGKIK